WVSQAGDHFFCLLPVISKRGTGCGGPSPSSCQGLLLVGAPLGSPPLSPPGFGLRRNLCVLVLQVEHVSEVRPLELTHLIVDTVVVVHVGLHRIYLHLPAQEDQFRPLSHQLRMRYPLLLGTSHRR